MADSGFEFGITPFYFLRHGETRESRDGILQGQNETELTPAGLQMAKSAAAALSRLDLGSIYASPLKRAWRTASVVSGVTGVPLHPVEGLMERHWGVFQGRPKADRPSTPNPETAETLEEFRHRVVGAMNSIRGPSPVLVVAHSGVYRVICDIIGSAPERGASVNSGEVLMLEPPTLSGEAWGISVVQ